MMPLGKVKIIFYSTNPSPVQARGSFLAWVVFLAKSEVLCGLQRGRLTRLSFSPLREWRTKAHQIQKQQLPHCSAAYFLSEELTAGEESWGATKCVCYGSCKAAHSALSAAGAAALKAVGAKGACLPKSSEQN